MVYIVLAAIGTTIFIHKDGFGEEQAKEKIIGLKLTEYSLAGARTTIVKWQMLNTPAKKIVLPVKSDHKIVLHVVWVVQVNKYNATGFSPNFNVYIDVVTGKVLMTEQLWRD